MRIASDVAADETADLTASGLHRLQVTPTDEIQHHCVIQKLRRRAFPHPVRIAMWEDNDVAGGKRNRPVVF
jgi:hypothetical protein